jgi:hypothetical protein
VVAVPVAAGEISMSKASLLLALGCLAAVFLNRFLKEIRREVPVIESHWGGLGGGLSGWRISASLLYFAGAVCLAAVFAWVWVAMEPDRRSGERIKSDLLLKYGSVRRSLAAHEVQLRNWHVENGKLILRASALSEAARNRVWDQIKLADPDHQDIRVDIEIGSRATSRADSPAPAP